MLRASLAAAAAVLSLSLAAPGFAPAAQAQGDNFTMPAYMMIIYPNGKTTSFPLDAKMAQDAMAHSQASSEPVMVLMEGGKAYVTSDTKMASGKMMSEYLENSYWNWTQRQH